MLSCAAVAAECSGPIVASAASSGPSFVGAGAGSVATAGTQSVAYPGSLASGYRLILFATAHVGTVSTPSGWTLDFPAQSNGASEQAYQFSRVSDGTETGSITLTSSSTYTVARMYAFRGCSASPYESGDTTTNNAGPDLTTVGANRLLFDMRGGYGSDPDVIAGASGGTWTLAASYRDAGTTMCCSLCTMALPSAGSVTGGATTSYGECAGRAFALIPA